MRWFIIGGTVALLLGIAVYRLTPDTERVGLCLAVAGSIILAGGLLALATPLLRHRAT